MQNKKRRFKMEIQTEKPIKTIKLKNGNVLEIHQDLSSGCDSREWDNLGIMVMFHKRYNLPNELKLNDDNFNSWDDLKKTIEKEHKGIYLMPILMYDHSGISLSTRREYPFNDRWDAGQVGFIFTTKERIKEMGIIIKENSKKAMDEAINNVYSQLEGEIKLYNQDLNGEKYGFIEYKINKCNLGHEHKENVNSCWGFYDIKDIEEEYKDQIETEIKEAV